MRTPSSRTRSPLTRIVVPLRGFSSSKRRLAGVLDANQRETLTRTMAEQVIDAAAGWSTAVACDDDEVECWARSVGAAVIRTDGHDLNGSARVALIDSRDAGWERVALAHADLPLVASFSGLLDRPPSTPTEGTVSSDTVTIVPDRRLGGTNLLVVPCHSDFGFEYGPGSFELHQQAALRAGLRVEIIHDDAFAWDTDEPEDLAIPPGPHTDHPRIKRLIEAGILTVSPETRGADE